MLEHNCERLQEMDKDVIVRVFLGIDRISDDPVPVARLWQVHPGDYLLRASFVNTLRWHTEIFVVCAAPQSTQETKSVKAAGGTGNS